jgi:hypothetical protein
VRACEMLQPCADSPAFSTRLGLEAPTS